MEEQNQNQEFSFIKEKIKEKPINKRRLAYKILWVVFSGMLFGFLACLTFVVVKPKLEKLMQPQPDTTVNFPMDDENQEDDSNGKNPNDNTSEQDPVIVEPELEISDFQNLQNKLYAIGKKANRSVVTVTGVTSSMDWFESAYESKTQAAGIIIANNGQELLILTEKKAIANAGVINITFVDGTVVPATMKKYDGNTGIAVISVALEDISQETMRKIDVAILGNSLTATQGNVVIAIGSPMGSSYSILLGTITSTDNNISVWDGIYTVFTTDIIGSTQGSGVLINLDGDVVGLIMQDYSSEADQNTLTALSVSQLKGIIEDLSNGKAIPYLGLRVSTVTDAISNEFGLPKGVYVSNVETDFPSPGMSAGIQAGDIIVAINGDEIKMVSEYTKVLHSLSPEQTVKIKLLRQSGENYVELVCTATVGVMQ